MSLVNELKNEHKVIVDVLTKVKNAGISTTQGQKLLFNAKSGLLSHLKKEDDKLYPVLNKAAESNNVIKALLSTLNKEMEGVAKGALDFFAKYEKGGDELEFAKDFGKLAGVLKGRILKEESMLYPKFDEVNK